MGEVWVIKAPAGAGPRAPTRSPCPWTLDSSGAIGQRDVPCACRHPLEVRRGCCGRRSSSMSTRPLCCMWLMGLYVCRYMMYRSCLLGVSGLFPLPAREYMYQDSTDEDVGGFDNGNRGELHPERVSVGWLMVRVRPVVGGWCRKGRDPGRQQSLWARGEGDLQNREERGVPSPHVPFEPHQYCSPTIGEECKHTGMTLAQVMTPDHTLFDEQPKPNPC
jgi:hypothetical protein